MSEYNPEAPIRLQFSNTTVELNRERTTAFTHREVGHAALNHLYLTDTDENGEYGSYIWFEQFGRDDNERQEFFSKVLQAMLDYNYYMVLNIPKPSDYDIDAYVDYKSDELDSL